MWRAHSWINVVLVVGSYIVGFLGGLGVWSVVISIMALCAVTTYALMGVGVTHDIEKEIGEEL